MSLDRPHPLNMPHGTAYLCFGLLLFNEICTSYEDRKRMKVEGSSLYITAGIRGVKGYGA